MTVNPIAELEDQLTSIMTGYTPMYHRFVDELAGQDDFIVYRITGGNVSQPFLQFASVVVWVGGSSASTSTHYAKALEINQYLTDNYRSDCVFSFTVRPPQGPFNLSNGRSYFILNIDLKS